MDQNTVYWQSTDNFKPFELRAHRFREEWRPLFFQYLGISPHSRVLDAGCGTGVLARYLARGLNGGHVTGFDVNPVFVAYGQTRLRDLGLENAVTLEVADGYHLLYADGIFDAVTNYTYLGVLSDPVAGLREMIRVCKPGGVVSYVVATNAIESPHWQGDYPFEGADELERLSAWENHIFLRIQQQKSGGVQNISRHELRWPKLFHLHGLESVHVYPFAHLCCYSDDYFPLEYRKNLALEETVSHISWLTARFNDHRAHYLEHHFSDADHARLIELLACKKAYLETHFDTDQSYEWYGAMNFIVTGVKGVD